MGGCGAGIRLTKIERTDLRAGDLAGGRGWDGVLHSRRAGSIKGTGGWRRRARGRGWRGQVPIRRDKKVVAAPADQLRLRDSMDGGGVVAGSACREGEWLRA
ncbi:hypothetical protein VPH35_124635 [Triticum aestivum]